MKTRKALAPFLLAVLLIGPLPGAVAATDASVVTLTLTSLSHATESTDNALFKGTNPLREAMGKPIFANRVHQNGYHCWDPALIKVGDTYHLFYSRWRMVPGRVNDLAHWMTTSEIVHATSSNILGPYTNIENPALSAKDNHGWWLHNCKVTPEYNPDGSIKRYALGGIPLPVGSETQRILNLNTN